MDPNKIYEAIEARNQPDWEARKAIFAGCHLLEEGEYTVVSDDYSGEVIPLED